MKKKYMKFYCAEDLIKKFAFVCEKESISVGNELSFLMRQKIAYYEKVKGKIAPSDAQKQDVCLFEDENE